MAVGTGGLLRKIFPGIGIEGADPDPKDPDPKPDPKEPKDPAKDPKPTDPLAQFAAIFDNKPAPKPGEEDIPLSVAGVLTEDTLSKLTENLDFNKFLTDTTREAIAKGDDPKALFTAFNEIAVGSYRTAISHSSKLSEQIMEDRLGRLEAGLGEKINAHQVQSKISANEIINKSPVLKSGILMIAEKLRQQQPDADPEWITKTATDFLLESAKVLSGGVEGDSNPGQPGDPKGNPAETETDWMGFAMGDEINNPGGDDPTSGDTGA